MYCLEQVSCVKVPYKWTGEDSSFLLFFVGNHTFAAMRSTESYSSLQSLAVVLEDMNNLIANPYINIEGRWRLHIVLGGDYKVCVATITLPLVGHFIPGHFHFYP